MVLSKVMENRDVAVISFGISATLMFGERTVYSIFKILLRVKNVLCNMSKTSNLFQNTKFMNDLWLEEIFIAVLGYIQQRWAFVRILISYNKKGDESWYLNFILDITSLLDLILIHE